MRERPQDHDPELTEVLLEEGGKRLHESRRLLQELDQRIFDRRDPR